MATIAKAAFWLALAVWVGGIVFVSFVVAPVVFRSLPRETAGLVMGHIFPLYYAVSAGAGVVALATALLLWRAAGRARAWTVTVVMLSVMLAATTYAGAVVQPRASALRPALHQAVVDPMVRADFERLHRRAVQLNGLVLLLGLATIVVTASSARLPGE